MSNNDLAKQVAFLVFVEDSTKIDMSRCEDAFNSIETKDDDIQLGDIILNIVNEWDKLKANERASSKTQIQITKDIKELELQSQQVANEISKIKEINDDIRTSSLNLLYNAKKIHDIIYK